MLDGWTYRQDQNDREGGSRGVGLGAPDAGRDDGAGDGSAMLRLLRGSGGDDG